MRNDKGARWLVLVETDEFPFAHTVAYDNAEAARKAARLENRTANRDVAKIYRDIPGRPLEEIMV